MSSYVYVLLKDSFKGALIKNGSFLGSEGEESGNEQNKQQTTLLNKKNSQCPVVMV